MEVRQEKKREEEESRMELRKSKLAARKEEGEQKTEVIKTKLDKKFQG